MDSLKRKCAFCEASNPPYTCPRCQQPYCKLLCYRSDDHIACSENFYKDWVKTCLSGSTTSDEGKAKMVEILKRLQREDEDQGALDSDDDDYGTQDDADGEVADLNSRLFSMLEMSSPDDLWKTLTPSDKEAVKDLLDSQAILLWSPWWYCKEPGRKLITEIGVPEERLHSPVPNVPEKIPKLHTLTSRSPCDTVQYQVLNVIAAYVFTARHYNGEHMDEAKEAAQMLMELSSALQNNFHSMRAVESVYLVQESGQGRGIHGKTLCLVFDDLCEILKGPENDKDCHYVYAALSDIKQLLIKGKEKKHSEEKKKINLTIKKVEYLLSWNQDFGCNLLKQHLPSLQIEIASIMENVKSLEQSTPVVTTKEPKVFEV